jgi:glutamate-5-semialdehyde dehydrogenase
MNASQQIITIARNAREASRAVASLSTAQKNRVLRTIARLLAEKKSLLQAENEKDLAAARGQQQPAAFIDRLTLSGTVLEEMRSSLEEVAQLPDPVGEVTGMWKRPNGLLVGRMRIPIGVIAMIYESRPNVTVDAAGLCLKAGNAVILRGGSEALHSNRALAALMQEALTVEKIHPAAIQVIPVADRNAVLELLQLSDLIDVVIPRGGESLIRTVYENSKIPVIAHYKGVCHVFIDASADPGMSQTISLNAKVQRPGVCNAMETLLVHREFAEKHLAELAGALLKQGVTIRGCERTCRMVPQAERASEEDWSTEYLDLRLSLRVVDSIDEAIDHIARYGSLHTEAIVTGDYASSQKFLREVNSSVVLVNASTRFNDGNQLGLGAEIGISTSKLHAFGPMGLTELTTTKFIVYGEGQVRT